MNLAKLFAKRIDSFIVVDVSDNLKLTAVEVKADPRVTALKTIELPKEKKEEAILNACQVFLKENHLSQRHAILIPSLSQRFGKRIKLAAVPDAELFDAVKWKIKDDLPFSLDKAVLGYLVVDRVTKDDGAKVLEVLCIAALEDEIKRQVFLLKQLGLSCVAVIQPAFGYLKLLEKYSLIPKEETVALLQLNQNTSFLIFYTAGKIIFYRELPVLLAKLKDSLSGVLVSDKGKVQLSPQEADEVLYTLGIPLENNVVYKDKMAGSQILALLRPSLENMAQEITRSLSYYNAQFGAIKVQRIFLGGTGLKVPNLARFLARELSLDIAPLPRIEKIKAAPGVSVDTLIEDYASIGAAIDYEKNINLLPQEFRTEKIEKFQLVSLRWVALVVFSLLTISFILAKAGVGAYEKRLEQAKFQLNVISEVRQIKAKSDAMESFFREVKNAQPPIDGILRKISCIAPACLFFQDFSLKAEEKTGQINGFVKSTTLDPERLLAKFVDDLQASGYFQDVDLGTVTKEDIDGQAGITFSLNFKLR